jgi:hypothetical protein
MNLADPTRGPEISRAAKLSTPGGGPGPCKSHRVMPVDCDPCSLVGSPNQGKRSHVLRLNSPFVLAKLDGAPKGKQSMLRNIINSIRP